jgi:hypothetical protein
MKFTEKVGNIKAFIQWHCDRSITVSFYNGTDLIATEVYFNATEKEAIEDLFRKQDIYTIEWLNINISNLSKLSDNTYQSCDDYFCRIDDTRYFKHFLDKGEWIRDKFGKRIIDR